MSGETKSNISSWTIDSLKEYNEQLIAEIEKRNEQRFSAQQQAVKDALISQKEAVAAALVAAEKAVLVAEQNAEKWRSAANEWRGAMNDRERTLMPRAEAEAALKSNAQKTDAGLQALNEKIDALQGRLDRNEGRNAILMPTFDQMSKEMANLSQSHSEVLGAKNSKGSQQQLMITVAGLLITGVLAFITIASVIVTIAYAIRK